MPDDAIIATGRTVWATICNASLSGAFVGLTPAEA
jgi:hypothetical protein